MKDNKYILEVNGVDKSFPGVKALSQVSLRVRSGEVMGIVGENGAGKSTLIKVLTGIHQRDSGSVRLDGKEVRFQSTQDALNCGIVCIYQEINVVPLLDVGKNIFLHNLPMKFRHLDRKTMYQKTRRILEDLEMNISERELAGNLSIAQQQMIEIARAISRDARIIIMDEPTSSLSEKEVRVLFRVIRSLKEKGITFLFVSHKLDEIKEITDHITVFRDGCTISELDTKTAQVDQIIHHMIGRTIKNYYNKLPNIIGDAILKVENFSGKRFKNVSFEVLSGEVLGFFGLVGAGRSEIMRAIFGVDPHFKGDVFMKGRQINIQSPKDAINHGIGLVPEDRKHEGLVLNLSVMINTTMASLQSIQYMGIIDSKKERNEVLQYKNDLQIKTPNIKQLAANLSGGNQQKVVVAKWLMNAPKVLILDEPTRGIDVGTKAEIYSLISKLAKLGVAIIVVSSELPELMGLCDRIMTVYEGRITSVLNVKETTDAEVLSYALGGLNVK